MSFSNPPLAVVIPAAGIGKRMQAEKPKQYLKISGQTILQHTINKFLALNFVKLIVVVLSEDDIYFNQLTAATEAKVVTAIGGKERADSVLNGIKVAEQYGLSWLMVHDAARPCVLPSDITKLYHQCMVTQSAGILAVKVRDTMKRAIQNNDMIDHTVSRVDLWHALTPQCCQVESLKQALHKQLSNGLVTSAVTDEASALELNNESVSLVSSSMRNIKITEPEDLQLAELYLQSEGI